MSASRGGLLTPCSPIDWDAYSRGLLIGAAQGFATGFATAYAAEYLGCGVLATMGSAFLGTALGDLVGQSVSMSLGEQDGLNYGQALQAGVAAALVAGTLQAALSGISSGCFAAGTPLLTPNGSRPIEQFRPGDLVLSRSENDATGPLHAKRVEEVFVRIAPIMEIQVGGRTISTTTEHPFWVVGQGWCAASVLRTGARLLSADGGWLHVDALLSTGRFATVYNLRVANYHTYFVGGENWGFSVWAHNAYDPPQASLPANTGKKTAGVLHVEGQNPLPLQSGVNGPSQAVRGEGLPGFNGNQLTHVEGHSAAYMRTNGIREAVLDINKAPCTQGSGGGCEGLLPRMLPEGATRRVRGPGGYDRTFVGLPD